jgi:hypothetical protein
MKAYRTTRTVRLSAGTVLALAAAQAAPRAHLLYGMEPGVYTAKEPLEFKAGEVIGLMTPPAKGDSGLEDLQLNWLHSEAGPIFEPVDAEKPNNPESDTEIVGDNPGAALVQAEVDPAPVQAQASKAEALEPERPTAAGEAAASDNPQSGNGLDSAQTEESKSGRKSK